MQTMEKAFNGIGNLFKNRTFDGFIKESNKTKTLSYKRMKANLVAKRRAKNKVARKSRRKQLSKRGPGRNKRLLTAI